jgi:hypothetical protein
MARKKVMETTYLYPEQLAAMRARKGRTHIPVAEQIRTAVQEYLERLGEALPPAPEGRS